MTPETALVFGTDLDQVPDVDTRSDAEREADWAEIRRDLDLDMEATIAMEADRANEADGWHVHAGTDPYESPF